MNRLKQLPWLRISAEGAAIIASILLAFWIQAWWVSRQDRFDERIILRSLLLEFRNIKATLESNTRYNTAIRDSIRQITNAAVGPENSLNEEDIDRLIADMWWNQDMGQWVTPALSSLISSGKVELVSNFALRRRLEAWPITLGSIRDILQRDLKYFTEQQMPILARLTSLPQILNADDGAPGNPHSLYDSGRKIELRTKVSHMEVLANREFQNMLMERDVCLTDILTLAFDGLAAQIDETIRLLEEELSLEVE